MTQPRSPHAAFEPAETKGEAIARIGSLLGVQLEGTRGEKRALLALRDALGLDLPTVETGAAFGQTIAGALDEPWDDAQNVERTRLNLRGLNTLLRGTWRAYVSGELRQGSGSNDKLQGAEWSEFVPAVSKMEAVTRIAALTAAPPERLGPGGKEQKSVISNLASALLPDLPTHRLSKTRLAEAVARRFGAPWGDWCISTGETIRKEGLNAILAGAERRLGRLGDSHAGGLSPESEGAALVSALSQRFLSPIDHLWDGRKKVEWLRDQGTRQENQSEWPGFYFEHRGRALLSSAFRPNPDPPRTRFGNTLFDFSLNHVWDLKAHTTERLYPSTGRVERQPGIATLNDVEAIRECVAAQGLGFVVASGLSTADETGDFKHWHDEFKGKQSAPSLTGNSRGRKSVFRVLRIEALWIPDLPSLDEAIAVGALTLFKQGRQQSGAPRRVKYKAHLRKARAHFLVASSSANY